MAIINITSADAAKLLRKIGEERDVISSNEGRCATYNAASGEDKELLRPEYDYEETQKKLAACDRKVLAIKHAINCFNSTQLVGDTGMTIDQVLIYLPQLNNRKIKLGSMQSRLPVQRANTYGLGSNAIIDYVYANYDVEKAKSDYLKVSEEIRNLQSALDVTNNTVTFEVDIPEE